MFLAEHAWIQVIVFTCLSLLQLLYLVDTLPYKERYRNRLDIINEVFILTISYLVMVINGVCYQSEQQQANGLVMTRILYVDWCINGSILFVIAVKEIYKKFKRCLVKRKRKQKIAKRK